MKINKNKFFYIGLIWFCFISKLQAYENHFAMKLGLSSGFTLVRTYQNKIDEVPAIGFNTHFGYRFKKWELNTSSYVNVSSLEKSRHRVANTTFNAEGRFRSVTFAIMAKYIFEKKIKKTNIWNPYISLGPAIGLQTFKFESITNLSENSISTNDKLTYDTFGLIFALGVEELLEKNSYPVYMELSYKIQRTHELSKVNGTQKKQQTVFRENPRERFTEHSLLFTLGMTVL